MLKLIERGHIRQSQSRVAYCHPVRRHKFFSADKAMDGFIIISVADQLFSVGRKLSGYC